MPPMIPALCLSAISNPRNPPSLPETSQQPNAITAKPLLSAFGSSAIFPLTNPALREAARELDEALKLAPGDPDVMVDAAIASFRAMT